MELRTVLARLRRRWWIVAAMAALALLGAGLTLGGRTDRHERTIHFVLRPDSSVSTQNLPNALEELKSDGALVQTVLGALSSNEMLGRAETAARLRLPPEYTVESTARPGSALIDSTVRGPEGEVVDRLATGFASVASDYVAASYSAYVLDRLGADPGGEGTGLHPAQIVVLALLLGGALGVGLVLAELRLESSLRPIEKQPYEAPTVEFEAAAGPARESVPRGRIAPEQPPNSVWMAKDTRCRATTSKGAPCRNRRVDDRGYCRLHLTRLEGDRADPAWKDGTAPLRLAGPAARPLERTTRPGGGFHTAVSHEDDG